MKLTLNSIILIYNIVVLHKDKETALVNFCEQMGLVYIKLAQILSMQGMRFIDANKLSSLCTKTKQVSYSKICRVINREYTKKYKSVNWRKLAKIQYIEKVPIGYASVSQVHKGTIKINDKLVDVVFKIKRQNIEADIEKDLSTIRILIKYFGWVFGLRNYKGVVRAVELESKWIKRELDFASEVRNIEMYRLFSQSVGSTIHVPKVYPELCTENIIVMEYIDNNYMLTSQIKDSTQHETIIAALNNYIHVSFKALFEGKEVVFHGDPHIGNIYIDNNGNIGFLDMGLMFKLTEQEVEQTKRLFLWVWFGRKEELFNYLSKSFKGTNRQLKRFKIDLYEYIATVKFRSLTSYFMDLMIICLRYNIVPEEFLFNLAKAFICLGGLSDTLGNNVSGVDLLEVQVIEYLIKTAEQSIPNILESILCMDRYKLIEAVIQLKKQLNL